MKTSVLAVLIALLLAGGALYISSTTHATPAAVATSVSSQVRTSLFDTSRMVELLKSLLALRIQQAALLQTPNASSSVPYAPMASTTVTATKPPVKPVSAKAPTPTALPLTSTETKLGLVLPTLRSALVNVVCLPTKAGTGLRGSSGSGVIIDPRGIILTVAHVAQYQLLAAERPDLISCTIRTGSPAATAYIAKPIYVSSEWIEENAKNISSSNPKGSGANDYALLAITSSATSNPLPASFPYVSFAAGTPAVKEPVVIGSYGAEFLTSVTIRSGIFPTLVFGAVREVLTLGNQTIDVISLGGGAAAQEGSSGGGVVNQNGQFIGLITTRSNAADLNNRDLRAITSTYLQRAFRDESGDTLKSYLASSPASLVSSYAAQASRLASELIKENRIGN